MSLGAVDCEAPGEVVATICAGSKRQRPDPQERKANILDAAEEVDSLRSMNTPQPFDENVEADDGTVDCTGLWTTLENCVGAGPKLMQKLGVFSIEAALVSNALQTAQEKVAVTVQEVHKSVLFRSEMGSLGKEQLGEVNWRDGSRLDTRYRMDEEPFVWLAREGPWIPVVRSILFDDMALVSSGVMVALASQLGSDCEAQVWHQDGGHLFDAAIQLPCHCLNVFVPLVDVDERNGITEFLLGSHQTTFDKEKEPTMVSLACRAGTAIVFDYRIWYRGGANRTAVDCPVLYFVYARSWFKDHKNMRATKSRMAGLAIVPSDSTENHLLGP